MKCVYFDCDQGASAELMLGALTAAQDGLHVGAAPVVYRLPGGAQVRCARATADHVIGRRVEFEFPEGMSAEDDMTRTDFEEFARAAVPEGAARELLTRFGDRAYAAVERSRTPGQADSIGVTRGMAAVLAALALRLAADGTERVFYSKVNCGDLRGAGGAALAITDIAWREGIRTYMTPGAGELLSLGGAAVLAAMGECARPSIKPCGGGVGLDGERRMYALLGEWEPVSEQPESGAQADEVPAQAGAGALPVRDDRVALIECNIDDMSPEQLAYACQLLMERGALDVWQTPIVMKKGRMAAQLSVLCAEDALERLTQEVLRQTSTLGVRIARYERKVLPRSQRTVDTRFGQVRVKLAPGKAAPEYEDCRAAAQRCGVPVADVYAAARGAVEASR